MKHRLTKLFLMILAVAIMPTAAHAESQLAAAVTSTSPLGSKVTLKNTSSHACQIANTALGTVSITRVVQDGKDVVPVPYDVSFVDGLDHTLSAQLKTLKAGESLDVPLRAVKSGGQVGLQSITWSLDGGTLGLLYMVNPDRPLQLELNYAVPLDSPNDVPICGSVQASNIETNSWLKPLLIGIGVVIAVILAGVLVWWLRKRRKKKPIVAAVLLLAVGTTLLGMYTQPVQAHVTVPASMQAEWDNCVATFRANSDITGSILNIIDSPSVQVVIDPLDSGITYVGTPWPDGSYHLNWNLHDGHVFRGGGTEDPCMSAYHELYHVLDMENHTMNRDDCAGSGIETKEVMATRAENQLRARLGMTERTHYGARALPSGDCRARPASPPPCRSTSCARSIGEPHLLTFDGHHYDFQAAGEFVLARTKTGNFEIQTRQQPWQDSRWVAVNTAAVIKTANHKIQVTPDGYKLAVLVDGKKQPLAAAELPGGDTLTPMPDSNRIDITTADGTTVTVFGLGNYGIDISIDPAEELKGKLEGLLGDYDGETKNDLRLQGKNTTVQSDFGQLYPAYADSWRVTDQSSLFTYASGKTTASYTNRAFPYERPDMQKLASYAAAEALCKRLGITDAASLANCALDVAITGRPEFARSAARYQGVVAGKSEGATEYTLEAKQPGDIGKVTFAGKKDEKVFVDIYSSTFPSICGAFSLRDSDDHVVSDGCIIAGKGFIDTTTLPADDTYSLQLRASDGAAGQARVRLYRIADQTGTVALDGTPVTATISRPGMQARFTFNAAAGQRLFVDTSDDTLPSLCSPLAILGADGQTLGSGCIINGKGSIDTVVVPETGQYTLQVDPGDVMTGKITLHLTTSQLLTKNIAVGDAVKLNFGKPGDEAEVHFAGSAGQRVYIDVSGSTLPSQCGGFGLRMPNGDKVDGCVIGKEDSLKDDGIVLPASGGYVIFLNPSDANTGEMTVRVRQ